MHTETDYECAYVCEGERAPVGRGFLQLTISQKYPQSLILESNHRKKKEKKREKEEDDVGKWNNEGQQHPPPPRPSTKGW